MPIDLHSSDPKEARARDKYTKKLLANIIECENKLRDIAQLFEMPKTPTGLGYVDSNIYNSSPRRIQRDILTRLPNELNARVWAELDDPADRMMLALTCKSNAHMFESLKSVKAQSPVKKKIAFMTIQKSQRIQKGTETQVMTLLRRLQPWMKRTQDLCYVCKRYRLKAATVAVRSFTEKGGWGGKVFPAIGIAGGKKTSLKELQTAGRRCPDCVLRKHVEYQKHSSDYKRSLRKLERIGAFDPRTDL